MNSAGKMVRNPVVGSGLSGIRDMNARLVLSYIRRYKRLAGAEIARRSGLSAQTVSNILRDLEAEGLVKRGLSVKGRVGKPLTPMELNPGGVHALGLNIGRRTAELVLADFSGEVLAHRAITYAFPEIETVFRFLREGMPKLLRKVPAARATLAGIGVSRPNEIWAWLEQANAPQDAMRRWKDIDIRAEIAAATGLDVIIANDATSACLCEHLLGRGGEFTDYAYIFVGAFVGGGLVLGGKIVWGRTGNAAALGILPVFDDKGRRLQLLDVASLHVLESRIAEAGVDFGDLRKSQKDWSVYEEFVAPWIRDTGPYLAIAAASIASVAEVEAVLIDGAMPRDVLARLVDETEDHFETIDLSGVERPTIEMGSRGGRARSIGASLLPIHSRYFLS